MKTTKLLLSLCAVLLTTAMSWGQGTPVVSIAGSGSGVITPLCVAPGATATIKLSTSNVGYNAGGAGSIDVSINGGATIAPSNIGMATASVTDAVLTLTGLVPGTYTISVYYSGGTTSGGNPAQVRSATARIRVDAPPVAPTIVAAPTTICGGLSSLVRVTNPVVGVNYSWSSATVAGLPAAAFPATITGSSTTVTPNVGVHAVNATAFSTMYPAQVAADAAFVCKSATEGTATVTVEGPAEPTLAASSATACEGPANIAISSLTTVTGCPAPVAGTPAGVVWFNASGVNVTANTITNISGDVTYSVRCRSSAGCLSGAKTFKVTKVAIPTAPQLATSPLNLCQNSSGTLTVSVPTAPSNCETLKVSYNGVTTDLSASGSIPYAPTGVASPLTIGTSAIHTFPNGTGEIQYKVFCLGKTATLNATAGTCPGPEQVLTVQVLAGPSTTAPTATDAMTFCKGADVKLTASGCKKDETIAWYNTAGTTLIGSVKAKDTGTHTLNLGVKAAGSYSYSVRCEVGGCYSPFDIVHVATVLADGTAAPTVTMSATSACVDGTTITPATFTVTANCPDATEAKIFAGTDLSTALTTTTNVTVAPIFEVVTGTISVPSTPGTYTYLATCKKGTCWSGYKTGSIVVSTKTTAAVAVVEVKADNVDNNVFCDNQVIPDTKNILGTKVLATANCMAEWKVINAITGDEISTGSTAAKTDYTYADFTAAITAGGSGSPSYALNAVYKLKANCGNSGCVGDGSGVTTTAFIFTKTVPPTINVVTTDGATPTPTATIVCRGSDIDLRETSGLCAGIVRWYAKDKGATTFTAITAGSINVATSNAFTGPVEFRAVCEGATCTSEPSHSVKVEIAESPTAPTITATPSPTGCQPANTIIDVTLTNTCAAGETVQYQSKGTTFTNTTSPATITVPATGSVTMTYRATCKNTTSMCKSSNSAEVSVMATSQVAAPTSVKVDGKTDAIAKCVGGAVALTASGCDGGTLTWFNAATNANVGVGNPLTLAPAVGTVAYKATCTIGSGATACTSQYSAATQNIVVSPALNDGTFKIVPKTGFTTMVCPTNALAGKTTDLQTEGCTGAIDWYKDSATGTKVKENSNFYDGVPAGTYVATCNNGACSITTTIVITEHTNPNPMVSVAPSATGLCAGGSISLTASSSPAATTYVWNSTGLDLLKPENINSATISSNNASTSMTGTYTVLMNVGVCNYAVSQSVEVSGGNILDLNIINLGAPVSERVPGATIAEWNIAPKTPSSVNLAQSSATSPTIYSTVTPTDGAGNAANGAPRYWTAEAKTCAAIAPRSMKFTIATTAPGSAGINVAGTTVEAGAPWFLFNNVGYRKLWSVADATWGLNVAGGWPEGQYSITVDAYDGPTTTGNAYGTPTGNLLASKTFHFLVDPNPGARVGLGKQTPASEEVAVVLGNPVSEKVKVEINGLSGEDVQLNLTDLSGRSILLKKVKPSSNKHVEVLNVARQADGSYLLQVVGETKKATIKVIKNAGENE